MELRKEGERVAISLDEQQPAAITELEAGNYILEAKKGPAAQRIEFSVVEPSSDETSLTIRLEPETPLADDFLGDELALRMHSPLPLEDLEIFVLLQHLDGR